MMLDDYTLAHGDADLERAVSRFMQRTIDKPGVGLRNLHGLVAQLGAAGQGTIPINTMAVVPIVKPCRVIEWTLDGNVSGNLSMTVEYSPWATPRAWASITTDGTTLPSLASSDVAGSALLTGWTLLLDRKGAIRIIITSSLNVEQATLVIYVQDMPRGWGGPSENP